MEGRNGKYDLIALNKSMRFSERTKKVVKNKSQIESLEKIVLKKKAIS